MKEKERSFTKEERKELQATISAYFEWDNCPAYEMDKSIKNQLELRISVREYLLARTIIKTKSKAKKHFSEVEPEEYSRALELAKKSNLKHITKVSLANLSINVGLYNDYLAIEPLLFMENKEFIKMWNSWCNVIDIDDFRIELMGDFDKNMNDWHLSYSNVARTILASKHFNLNDKFFIWNSDKCKSGNLPLALTPLMCRTDFLNYKK